MSEIVRGRLRNPDRFIVHRELQFIFNSFQPFCEEPSLIKSFLQENASLVSQINSIKKSPQKESLHKEVLELVQNKLEIAAYDFVTDLEYKNDLGKILQGRSGCEEMIKALEEKITKSREIAEIDRAILALSASQLSGTTSVAKLTGK